MTNSDYAYPGLHDFMARRGLSAASLLRNRRLSVTIDGKYRLHFRPDSDARLVLYARIAPLPARNGSIEAGLWLARKMNAGAGLLRDYASTLCIEPQHDDLLLQQSIAAGLSGAEIAAEVEEFVNALQFWVKTGKKI